jgi:hypothetical protein
MTHTIEISDDAWIILKRHLHASNETQADACDELFTHADEEWVFFSPNEQDAIDALKRLKAKYTPVPEPLSGVTRNDGRSRVS